MHSSYSFTNSARDWGEWSASRPGCPLPRVKDHGAHWIGGWVSLRAVLDTRLDEKSITSAGDRTSIARSSIPFSDTILTELPRLQNSRVVPSNVVPQLSLSQIPVTLLPYNRFPLQLCASNISIKDYWARDPFVLYRASVGLCHFQLFPDAIHPTILYFFQPTSKRKLSRYSHFRR
jgi:hypothetical protein